MRVLFAFADSVREWNCSQWRSLTPSDAINKYSNGKHSARCLPVADFAQSGHPAIQEFVNGFDIVIAQRNVFDPQIWAACDYWRALGKIVCVDLDDDYPRLTPQNPAHPFWIADVNNFKEQLGDSPIHLLREALRHVDALLSPNRKILEDWSDIVPGYYLPNYAEGEWYEGTTQKPMPRDDEQIIVGWGGSVSHFDSWFFSGLRDAMIPLLDKYPRLHWKLCGNDWRLMKWARETLPEERWHHQHGVPPPEWPAQVASFDIGVAPLCGPGAPQSEAYDQRRSWLKAIEYLLCGVPWIGSPGGVYDDLDGLGGFVIKENSPQEWMEAVSWVVDNLTTCKPQSAALMEWAFDNLTIGRQVEPYMATLTRVQAEVQARNNMRLPDVIYVSDLIQQEGASVQ